MKRRIRMISLFLALLLLGSTLAGCAAVSKPLNYFKNALEKTIDRRFGGEMIDIFLEVLEGGSVELDFGGTDLVQTPLEKGNAKLWFDQEEKRVTASGALTVGGKSYDGCLYLTAEEMAVSSVAFLGSTDLGINFGTLSGDLQNSIFRNNSNTAFSRPEVDESTAGDVVELRDSFFTVYGSIGDVLALSDELTDDFLAILTEYAPHSRYSEDGKIHIAVKVDNTALSRALRDTRTKAVKNKTFCRELRELAAVRDAVISVKTGTVVTEWSDKVESFIASDISIEELCAKIDAMPPFAVQMNGEIGRASGIIEKATLSYSCDNAKVFELSVDLSQKDVNVLRLQYGGVTRVLSYRVLKDGFRYYDAEILYEKLSSIGENVLRMSGTLSADKSEDKFVLSLNKGEDNRVFEGSFDKKIDGFEVSVDTVKINGEEHRFSLSLAIKTDDKAAPLPEYVNLATVSEARFEPIAARITQEMNTLRSAWGEHKITARGMLTFFLNVIGMPEEIPPEPRA
ncbi:MAG: hypothetical protein J6B09_00750 [Clostridia bacterium]|nr:hypothetical protein [Clostridia bacterium]